MATGPVLRLVLPHQLFENHMQAAPGTVFGLVEHDLLFRQYAFHSHKLVLHRASMDRFARRLRGRGYQVEALRSDSAHSSHEQIAQLTQRLQPSQVTWFDVVDDWLEQELVAALEDGGYTMGESDILETPNFFTTRAQIDDWFAQHASRMQEFYIWQRRRLNLLVDDHGGPVGGKWSFDAENRKKLPRGYIPPTVERFAAGKAKADDDVVRAVEWVNAEFPDAPGDPQLFAWPTNAEEARRHLREFVRERLSDFGPYEDAISSQHPFISHGLLTSSLNIGLLDPREAAAHLEPPRPPAATRRRLVGWFNWPGPRGSGDLPDSGNRLRPPH